MRSTVTRLLLLFIFAAPATTRAQTTEFSRSSSLALSTGLMNYQGDLNPNGFTLGRSKFTFGLAWKKPLNRWVTVRAGVNYGRLEAADRFNRDYLKPRNLSFFTSISEAQAGFELHFLDISKTRIGVYLFGGIAAFHFNPWTYDNNGNKTFLQPLSTEGQGLADFPGQKSYDLTQFALPLGGGIKYAVSENVNIGFEFIQRKTFTDYLDDVSSFYVDHDKLLAAKGPKAVELAYRGLASSNASAPYPAHGEQRGTPTEMDWYYTTTIHVEIKLAAFSGLLRFSGNNGYQQRCPRPVL